MCACSRTVAGGWRLWLTLTFTPTTCRVPGRSPSNKAPSSGCRPRLEAAIPSVRLLRATEFFSVRRNWLRWARPATPESSTYLLEDAAAFTGDTLFLASVGRPDLEGGTKKESASRARQLHQSISRLLQLPSSTLVLPGHVSEPIAFDGRLLATTIGEIGERVALARLTEAEFVEAVLARIPPSPPNHSLIVELNERGELPNDPAELEAGANRCAVA
jgi:hypothetical protein